MSQSLDPALQERVRNVRKALNQEERVRILVGIKAAHAPEPLLGASARSLQRADIARVQQNVLRQLPQAARLKARAYQTIPYMALQVNAAQLEALLQSTEVTDILQDHKHTTSLGQSVPLIRANAAWAATPPRTGSGAVVAVIDNGVQNTHPFVAGSIVAEACFSTNNQTGSGILSLCPGGQDSATTVGSASNCSNATHGDWACGHGTHVAGTVLGNGPAAGQGFSGVAKDADLLAIQVFVYDTATQDSFAYTSDIIQGLEHVYALKATLPIAAVNMSLGGGSYTSTSQCNASNSATKAAIDQLRAAGVATVVASGNEGYVSSLASPACISSAISVGSTFDASISAYDNACDGWNGGLPNVDRVACYSNTASFLNLLAPGSEITSSVPNNSYGSSHGTSMAAPHVAGCWAILKSAHPAASVDQIQQALISSGVPVTDWRRTSITKPRIDCKAALDVLNTTSTNPSITITRNGAGSGAVSSNPAGINCGSTCTAAFTSGANVVLTATPASGSIFSGWTGGGCTGTGTCTVAPTSATTVNARFELASVIVSLAKQGTGQGSVSSNQSGLNCGASCTALQSVSVAGGTAVTLNATPASGSDFAGWSGPCTGTSTCSFTASGSTTVTATFLPASTSPAPISRGTPLTNLSAVSDSKAYYQFSVPMVVTGLTISLSGGTGDVDLYVRASQVPTLQDFDCRPYLPGNAETCSFNWPQPASTYMVMLHAYTDYSGVSLSVNWQDAVPPPALTVRKVGIGQGSITSTAVVYPNQASAQSVALPKIVGGTVAANGAWPWQAQVHINKSGAIYQCGGSLIAARWVLTAAHCVIDNNYNTLPASSFDVRLGSNTWGSGGQAIRVSRVIKHSAYNPYNEDNDIALLELVSAAQLGGAVATIRPLTPDVEPSLATNGKLATVTGWGSTYSGGSGVSSLRQVQVPLLSPATCAAITAYGSNITNNMLCAGYEQGGKDSCHPTSTLSSHFSPLCPSRLVLNQ
ncbi:trypsin-like serine protease [Limnohabitans sp.]|uniref:trypsin-like serine protease n=2 Tax=Limnohabitans sp. TaxID=1907725 RepID=UPI0025B7F3F5|nr:trypsin-like serine protease [Limnohabitans sp.]